MKPRRWVVLALVAVVLPAAAAERHVTLKVTKQRLSEVVRLISEQAGVPIQVTANAGKEIPNLDVEGSVEKVLGMVARFGNLTVRKEGDGYVLEPEPKAVAASPAPDLVANALSGVIARVKPRVALVVAYLSVEQARAQGTGFMAGPDGLLVTNAHVVKGATAIQVVFADNTSYYAVVAAMDEDKDLAILRVPVQFPDPLRLGDSDQLREGDDVALTGYPMALELLRNGIPLYASTAKATVNAVRPGRSLLRKEPLPHIQIDAPINPGNSGAPLYRLDNGFVVGVVQSKLAYEHVHDTGVGFAIPINLVRRLLADARANPVVPPATPPVPLSTSNVPLSLPPPAEGGNPGGPDAPLVEHAVTRPFDLLPIERVPPIPEPAAAPGVIALHAPGGKMVADPGRPRLYAADFGGNSVVAIDTNTGAILGRIFTGSKPYGVAIGAEGRLLYVANSGGSEISVLDLDTLTPLGCVPLSFRPFDLVLGPGGRLYTTASGGARSSPRAIDLRREMEVALGGTPVAGGALLAATPSGEKVFTAERGESSTALLLCEGAGKVSPAAITDASLLGSRIQDLALSPDGKRLYLASASLSYVSVLDAETLRPLGQLEVGDTPTSVALSSDGHTAYVCHRKEHLDRFDTRTFLRTGTLALPAAPLRCAVSPDGTKLFAQLPAGIALRDTSAFGPVRVGREPPVPE